MASSRILILKVYLPHPCTEPQLAARFSSGSPSFPKTQHKTFPPVPSCLPNYTTSSSQEDQLPSLLLPPLITGGGQCACITPKENALCRDLNVDAACLGRKRPQAFDHFLVLDLEGMVEILEFPVLLIDAKTMRVLDLFHRFVRPSGMSQQRVDEYIANKYGKFGVDRVWHDTAIPFNEVLQQFETWLNGHHLWEKKHGGSLNRAAFVTCGNWDVKRKVSQQCEVARMKIPPYFMEWINLKDVYKNFYNPQKEARGVRTMMERLRLPMLGSHHLGIDDTKNIARVLLHMLADGAVVAVNAWRNPDSFEDVRFLYNNRIV